MTKVIKHGDVCALGGQGAIAMIGYPDKLMICTQSEREKRLSGLAGRGIYLNRAGVEDLIAELEGWTVQQDAFLLRRAIDEPQFSAKECNSCGWRHQSNAFRLGDAVEVAAVYLDKLEASMRLHRRVYSLGTQGRVVEWGQIAGPVWVRVEFADGTRGNFAPCELEHLLFSPGSEHEKLVNNSDSRGPEPR